MRVLLDTCVISELASRHPNPHVVAFVDSLDEQLIYLSVITIGEIKRGIEKLPPPPRQQALQEWLMDDLLVRFQDRLMPLDAGVMLAWGELVASLEQHGRRLPAMDSLIAATAVHGQLALVTRNVQDFAGTGLTILNPWDDPSVSR